MIVGVGELLWDVFPDGRKVAGGAPFNFAFHCHNLGHEAVIVSRVGEDELGRELRAEAKRLGLSDEFIQTDPTHPTGTVQVTVDDAGQPSYRIVENVAWDYIAWTPELERLAKRCYVVCCGTLAQRSAESAGSIHALLSGCRYSEGGRAYRVFDVNLRQQWFDRQSVTRTLHRTQMVKLSVSELDQVARLCGFSGNTTDERVRNLFQHSAGETIRVIVTDGENGCSIYQERGETITEPGVPARVVDTVGAGDSFTAAMVCLHLEGRSLADCAKFANYYAAKVCEHRGGTPRIDRAEVERAAW